MANETKKVTKAAVERMAAERNADVESVRAAWAAEVADLRKRKAMIANEALLLLEQRNALFDALDPRSLEVVADEIDGGVLGAKRAAGLRAIATNQRAAMDGVSR